MSALAPLKPYLRGAPPNLPFRRDAETIQAGPNFTLTTDAGLIDVLGEIAGGGTFEELGPHSITVEALGVECRCIDLPDLIRVKRAAGRPKDFEAIAELEPYWTSWTTSRRHAGSGFEEKNPRPVMESRRRALRVIDESSAVLGASVEVVRKGQPKRTSVREGQVLLEATLPGQSWRKCVGIEPTVPRANPGPSDLKSEEATRPQSLPCQDATAS